MWKLGILLIITTGLIFSIIPIRTHATMVDLANSAAPTERNPSSVVSNMYLTPGTVALIGLLLAIAGYIGFRIVRSS